MARIRRAKQRGVLGAGVADGQRPDRDAARHLDDRQQRVQPLQRPALHRHSQDRQRGLGGNHAGQVRRAARPGDDHAQSAFFGRAGVLAHPFRRAMRGDDAALVRDLELFEHLRRMTHRVPIRLAAHDDSDQRRWRFCHVGFLLASCGLGSVSGLCNQSCNAAEGCRVLLIAMRTPSAVVKRSCAR